MLKSLQLFKRLGLEKTAVDVEQVQEATKDDGMSRMPMDKILLEYLALLLNNPSCSDDQGKQM
jgi:hypothetical protein